MVQTPKILLVDDEPDIIEILQYNLEKEGFEIATASNGVEAVEIAKSFLPELVLLDVMMPKMDGIATAVALRKITALKNTFILFLTARSEEYSEVAAFEVGADDYIVKPIKPRALISRIKAILKRDLQGNTEDIDETQVAGQLSISRRNYAVILAGKPLSLPKKEFELLFFLMQNKEKVFSRDELLNRIWGADVYVVERTVDVHIRKVREKIGDNFIKTFKGIGYMFSLE
jgi:two-component system, OmpR family, alkaline phosphatase synthesis response regulator PhoP